MSIEDTTFTNFTTQQKNNGIQNQQTPNDTHIRVFSDEYNETINKEDEKNSDYKDLESLDNFLHEIYPRKQLTKGEKVLQYAMQYIGYNGDDTDGKSADIFFEHTPFPDADAGPVEWCAAFISYVIEESGIIVPDWYESIDNKAWCNNIYTAAKDANAIVDRQNVRPGDIILFDKYSDGFQDHIGIVVAVDEDGTIHTLEGNADRIEYETEEESEQDNGTVLEKTYPPDYEKNDKHKNTEFTFIRLV